MKELDTGYSLYTLLERQNLHLRGAGIGRDDSLYGDLKARLGCPQQGVGLGTWLKSSRVTARAFLNAFFGAVQPLSLMYREIYSGMKAAHVAGASEVARVALGAETDRLEFDLEEFATWVQSFAKVVEQREVLLWDVTSLGCFADVGRALVGDHPELVHDASGKPQLAPLPPFPNDPQLASALREGHEVLGSIVEMMRSSDYQPAVEAQVKISIGTFNEVSRRLAQRSPQWNNRANAMRMLSELPRRPGVREAPRESIVQVLQKVLDLPIWKYRWYLYEVWVAFRLLQVLQQFAPTVHVDEQGRLALVRGRATTFASFRDRHDREYTVEAQMETAILHASRRGICPDYRVVGLGTTLLVVECKQRALLVGASLEENMSLYELGCERSKLNVFVNYDQPDGKKSAPSRTVLIEQFRPGVQTAIQAFNGSVANALAQAGVVARRYVVLLDISGSMAGKYVAESHSVFWAWCRNKRIEAFYSFSDAMGDAIPVQDLSTGWTWLKCEGGTELDSAVRKVRDLHPDLDRLLLVTDRSETEHPLLLGVEFWCPSPMSAPAE